METGNDGVTEQAVRDRIAAAQEKIAVLQAQLEKLPSDKGPELKPPNGPIAISRGHQKVAVEKQIVQEKEKALTDIDQMLENAPPEVKDHCEHAVGKWLYPEEISPDQQKNLDASQTMLSRKMYEKNHPEKPLEQGDPKTMEQAERSMWRQRYKTEMPEPEIAQKELTKEDIKDLDTSQEFAFNLRYRRSPEEMDATASLDKDIEKEIEDIEPEKE